MSENVSGIPPSLKDNKLESEVLNILEEIDAPIGPGLVENCLRLPSKGNPGVTLKLNRNKDARKFLDNKKKLKDFDPESVNLPPGTKTYINEVLGLYYKKLWSRCKKMSDPKHFCSG